VRKHVRANDDDDDDEKIDMHITYIQHTLFIM
jgi:hypothetical protein